ncbi:MAG: hypothetical protein WDM96_16180 [Lacunisphaera sp.]
MLFQKLLEAVLDDVARHEKHAARGLGFSHQQFLVEADAVQAGHFPVGYDDVVIMRHDQFERSLAGAGRLDAMAFRTQDFPDEVQNRFLVVDDEQMEPGRLDRHRRLRVRPEEQGLASRWDWRSGTRE